MTREPYRSARRVLWVVDNGPSHRGWTAAALLTLDDFPGLDVMANRLTAFEARPRRTNGRDH